MFKRKMILLSLLIIGLLAFSSVSAGDVNETVVASENQTNDLIEIDDKNDDVLAVEERDVDDLGVTEENELSTSPGTFTDLARDIQNAGAELKLTRDYSYSYSKDSSYTLGITINKKITINGNGHIISGNNQIRAFYISANNVILNNISFVDCSSSSSDTSYSVVTYGGAVYWAGSNGVLSNCSFVNCHSVSASISEYTSVSATSYGGAVYWAGSNGVLGNCSFVNCHSSSSNIYGSSSSFGGAVYWGESNGVLGNCSFVNCYSSSSSSYIYNSREVSSFGGAVYWGESNGVLGNCSFVSCYSSSNSNSKDSSKYSGSFGGAVYWASSNGVLSNCSFVNCSSQNSGDAIYWRGSNGALGDCSFNNENNYQNFVYTENKLNPLFSLSAQDILFSENENILIKISSIATGNMKIYLYSTRTNSLVKDRILLINSSSMEILFDDLYSDCYNITVEYSGDEIFKSHAISAIFNVSKYHSNIVVSNNENITAGDNLLINITLDNDATGNIFIHVNNNLFNASVIKGQSVIDVPNVFGGNYTYTITYSGDSKYYNATLTKNISVKYKKSYLNFNIQDICFTESILIMPNITTNATGIIQVYIDNIYIDEFSIGKTYEIKNLNSGKHNITLRYSGDNYYETCLNTSSFKVNKINTSISILKNSLLAGNTILNIILNNKCEGNITIFVNKKSYVEKIIDGNAIFYIEDLSEGNYNYSINYSGDQNFNKHTIEGELSIKLQESSINISSWDIVEEGTVEINYNITTGISGIISVYVNSSFVNNVSVGEKLRINELNGKYSIKLVYNSNGFFSDCYDIINITVLKSFINLNNEQIFYGNSFLLKPNVTNEATGTIKIYIDNTYKTQINVGETYMLTELNAGNHTVKAIYSGDVYHASCENATILKVNKINTTMSVLPTKVIAGSTVLSVTLNNKATGTIKVNMNNKNYTRTLSGGKVNIYIDDLTVGDYDYTVSYSGDNNFYQNNIQGTLSVDGKVSNLNISTCDIYISEHAEIYYELTEEATGNISVYLNNNLIKTVKVGDEIKLHYLKAGSYTVKVVYSGDDYYACSECSALLEVKKIEPFYFFNNDIAGKNVPLEFVIVGEDATGYINLKINEMDYSNYQVSNGKSTVIINDLKAGSNNYTLYYSGDEKYEPINEFGVFYVDYQDSLITVDIPEISWGDLFIINPPLPKGATGIIEILIDNISLTNMSVGKNYRYNALNGGKHNLTVRYSGDDYFSENETTFEFNVKRFDSVLTVNSTIWANPSSTIVFQLNEETTGLIKLSINNKQYSGEVINGTCKITVNNLNIGPNNLIINYTGDSKYNPIYTVKELIVLLKDSKLNVNINNIISGNNLIIKPVVVNGAKGTCKIYVDDILKTTINVGSSYTLSKPSIGKHEIKIVYSGDSYFESENFTTSFRVFTVYPIVANDMQIIYGTDKYFQAKFYDEYGNALTNKYVQFNVNGTDYPVKTNGEGIATLNIKFDVGTYNVTSISILDEAKSNTLLVFHSVEAENRVIEYNSDYRFNATFLDETAKPLSKTGVIFILDGVTQPMVNTDVNGVAILDKALNLGTHTITSINTITNENMTNHVVVVSDINSIINVQDINDVDYGENPVLTINVGSDYLNANIIVKITGDKGYSQEFSQKASTQIIQKLTGLNADKYTVVIKYQNNDKLLNINLNKTFNVLKVNPAMDVNIKDAYSGGCATITVNVVDSNGTVSLKVGSRTFNEKLTNGRLVKTVTGLAVGDYNVEVLFEGDNNYNPMIKTSSFKMYHNIDFNQDFPQVILLYSEDNSDILEQINIENIIGDNNDVFTLIIDGKPIELSDESYPWSSDEENIAGYKMMFNIGFLKEGSHTWEIKYSNIANNVIGSKSGTFYVYKSNNYYDIFNFGLIDDPTIHSIPVKNINENVKVGKYQEDEYEYNYYVSTFVYEGIEYKIIDGLGYALIHSPIYVEFNPNDYTLYVDSFYKIENGRISDVISTYLILDGIYYRLLGCGEYTSSLNDNAQPFYFLMVYDNVCYKFLGGYKEAIKNVDYKIVNGKYCYMNGKEVDVLDGGDFAIINGYRYYIEDNYYQTILEVPVDDLILINGTFYHAVAGDYDEITGEYKKHYVIDDGKLFTVENGDFGSQIKLKESITDKYIDIPTLISSSSDSVSVKLPHDASGTITLNIDGKNYNFDVVNGVANVKVPELVNGNYLYTITYSGDGRYLSFTKTGTVAVNKQTTSTKTVTKITITLKTVKIKKSAKKLVLQATLKQGKNPLKGKKITFKFNGKMYKATTNAKGVAKDTIKKTVLKKLKVGKKIKYQASYGKILAKKTAKVRK